MAKSTKSTASKTRKPATKSRKPAGRKISTAAAAKAAKSSKPAAKSSKSVAGRKLSAAEAQLFDELLKKEEERKEAAKLEQTMKEREKEFAALKPDYPEKERRALWDSATPGTVVQVWHPFEGILRCLITDDEPELAKRTTDKQKKGDLINERKAVFYDKPLVNRLNSSIPVNAGYIFLGDIVKVGGKIKFPAVK